MPCYQNFIFQPPSHKNRVLKFLNLQRIQRSPCDAAAMPPQVCCPISHSHPQTLQRQETSVDKGRPESV